MTTELIGLATAIYRAFSEDYEESNLEFNPRADGGNPFLFAYEESFEFTFQGENFVIIHSVFDEESYVTKYVMNSEPSVYKAVQAIKALHNLHASLMKSFKKLITDTRKLGFTARYESHKSVKITLPPNKNNLSFILAVQAQRDVRSLTPYTWKAYNPEESRLNLSGGTNPNDLSFKKIEELYPHLEEVKKEYDAGNVETKIIENTTNAYGLAFNVIQYYAKQNDFEYEETDWKLIIDTDTEIRPTINAIEVVYKDLHRNISVYDKTLLSIVALIDPTIKKLKNINQEFLDASKILHMRAEPTHIYNGYTFYKLNEDDDPDFDAQRYSFKTISWNWHHQKYTLEYETKRRFDTVIEAVEFAFGMREFPVIEKRSIKEDDDDQEEILDTFGSFITAYAHYHDLEVSGNRSLHIKDEQGIRISCYRYDTIDSPSVLVHIPFCTSTRLSMSNKDTRGISYKVKIKGNPILFAQSVGNLSDKVIKIRDDFVDAKLFFEASGLSAAFEDENRIVIVDDNDFESHLIFLDSSTYTRPYGIRTPQTYQYYRTFKEAFSKIKKDLIKDTIELDYDPTVIESTQENKGLNVLRAYAQLEDLDIEVDQHGHAFVMNNDVRFANFKRTSNYFKSVIFASFDGMTIERNIDPNENVISVAKSLHSLEKKVKALHQSLYDAKAQIEQHELAKVRRVNISTSIYGENALRFKSDYGDYDIEVSGAGNYLNVVFGGAILRQVPITNLKQDMKDLVDWIMLHVNEDYHRVDDFEDDNFGDLDDDEPPVNLREDEEDSANHAINAIIAYAHKHDLDVKREFNKVSVTNEKTIVFYAQTVKHSSIYATYKNAMIMISPTSNPVGTANILDSYNDELIRLGNDYENAEGIAERLMYDLHCFEDENYHFLNEYRVFLDTNALFISYNFDKFSFKASIETLPQRNSKVFLNDMYSEITAPRDSSISDCVEGVVDAIKRNLNKNMNHDDDDDGFGNVRVNESEEPEENPPILTPKQILEIYARENEVQVGRHVSKYQSNKDIDNSYHVTFDDTQTCVTIPYKEHYYVESSKRGPKDSYVLALLGKTIPIKANVMSVFNAIDWTRNNVDRYCNEFHDAFMLLKEAGITPRTNTNVLYWFDKKNPNISYSVKFITFLHNFETQIEDVTGYKSDMLVKEFKTAVEAAQFLIDHINKKPVIEKRRLKENDDQKPTAHDRGYAIIHAYAKTNDLEIIDYPIGSEKLLTVKNENGVFYSYEVPDYNSANQVVLYATVEPFIRLNRVLRGEDYNPITIASGLDKTIGKVAALRKKQFDEIKKAFENYVSPRRKIKVKVLNAQWNQLRINYTQECNYRVNINQIYPDYEMYVSDVESDTLYGINGEDMFTDVKHVIETIKENIEAEERNFEEPVFEEVEENSTIGAKILEAFARKHGLEIKTITDYQMDPCLGVTTDDDIDVLDMTFRNNCYFRASYKRSSRTVEFNSQIPIWAALSRLEKICDEVVSAYNQLEAEIKFFEQHGFTVERRNNALIINHKDPDVKPSYLEYMGYSDTWRSGSGEFIDVEYKTAREASLQLLEIFDEAKKRLDNPVNENTQEKTDRAAIIDSFINTHNPDAERTKHNGDPAVKIENNMHLYIKDANTPPFLFYSFVGHLVLESDDDPLCPYVFIVFTRVSKSVPIYQGVRVLEKIQDWILEVKNKVVWLLEQFKKQKIKWFKDGLNVIGSTLSIKETCNYYEIAFDMHNDSLNAIATVFAHETPKETKTFNNVEELYEWLIAIMNEEKTNLIKNNVPLRENEDEEEVVEVTPMDVTNAFMELVDGKRGTAFGSQNTVYLDDYDPIVAATAVYNNRDKTNRISLTGQATYFVNDGATSCNIIVEKSLPASTNVITLANVLHSVVKRAIKARTEMQKFLDLCSSEGIVFERSDSVRIYYKIQKNSSLYEIGFDYLDNVWFLYIKCPGKHGNTEEFNTLDELHKTFMLEIKQEKEVLEIINENEEDENLEVNFQEAKKLLADAYTAIYDLQDQREFSWYPEIFKDDEVIINFDYFERSKTCICVTNVPIFGRSGNENKRSNLWTSKQVKLDDIKNAYKIMPQFKKQVEALKQIQEPTMNDLKAIIKAGYEYELYNNKILIIDRNHGRGYYLSFNNVSNRFDFFGNSYSTLYEAFLAFDEQYKADETFGIDLKTIIRENEEEEKIPLLTRLNSALDTYEKEYECTLGDLTSTFSSSLSGVKNPKSCDDGVFIRINPQDVYEMVFSITAIMPLKFHANNQFSYGNSYTDCDFPIMIKRYSAPGNNKDNSYRMFKFFEREIEKTKKALFDILKALREFNSRIVDVVPLANENARRFEIKQQGFRITNGKNIINVNYCFGEFQDRPYTLLNDNLRVLERYPNIDELITDGLYYLENHNKTSVYSDAEDLYDDN